MVLMRHATNRANNLGGFFLEIMRHLLYFLAPISIFKVSFYLALSSKQSHLCGSQSENAQYDFLLILRSWHKKCGSHLTFLMFKLTEPQTTGSCPFRRRETKNF